MKTKLGAMFALIAMFAFGQSIAEPLCSPPLYTNCVTPQWGEADPAGLDSLATPKSGALASIEPRPTKPAIHMAAYTPPVRGKLTTPKVIVDDGQKFAPETNALIAAILRASFDQDGNLEKGGEEIAAAAEKLQRVSPGHQLNLYVKSRATLKPDVAARVGKKVEAINGLLGKQAPDTAK